MALADLHRFRALLAHAGAVFAVTFSVFSVAAGARPETAPAAPAAPAPAVVTEGAAATPPAPRTKVLVLDVSTSDLRPSEVQTLTSLIAAHLQRYPQLDVVSDADMKRLIDLEAGKQSAGCDQASCLSELAGSLGAGLVVFGQAGRLGATTIITLNLFDALHGQAAGRQPIELRDLTELPGLVGPAVDQLMRPVLTKLGVTTAAPNHADATVGVALSARAAELYTQQALAICVDDTKVSVWWFCQQQKKLTENEFLRRYQEVTQKADLVDNLKNRNPGAIVIPIVEIASGVALGIGGVVVGYLTFIQGAPFLSDTTVDGSPVGREDVPIGAWGTGLGVLGGIGLVIYGAINAGGALNDSDGKPADHSLTELQGREALAVYNTALAERINRQVGAAP